MESLSVGDLTSPATSCNMGSMSESDSHMFDAADEDAIPKGDNQMPGTPPRPPESSTVADHPRRRGPRGPRRVMPPSPSGTFARLFGFDLACPNCGTADCVRSRSGLPWWKGTRQFDSWRSRWRCRACRRVFAVGLAVWPARRSGNRPRPDGRPVDTIPNQRERNDMRPLYGIIREESRGWREPVNLICNCPAFDGEHAPGCPLSFFSDE